MSNRQLHIWFLIKMNLQSFAFAEEVIHFNLNCIMAALDVENVFANIHRMKPLKNSLKAQCQA